MKNKEKQNETVEDIKINPQKRFNFFKRIQISIFKVENYGEFVLEKTGIAIKYLFKLMLLVSFIIALVTTIKIHSIVKKGFSYVQNEMPDFTLKDGIIAFKNDTDGYDKDLDFYVLYRTQNEITDNDIKDIEKDINKYSSAIVYLNDRMVYYNGQNYSYFKYSDIIKEYDFNISNKQELLHVLERVGPVTVDVVYFVATLLSMYIVNIVTIIFDIILVFCFGIIASRLCGVNMPWAKILSLSIYSLTLSILLNTVYTTVYTFTNFYVQYFDIVYILIAYIYLIAAILIIKSDVIKQKLELQKIIEVQKQVKDEIEEEKEKEKEEKKKKKKNNDEKEDENSEEEDPVIDREPDGSEI